MDCPTCGRELRDGARVCLDCDTYLEPSPAERAHAVATAVERDRVRRQAERLRPIKTRDSFEAGFRSLKWWTWIAVAAILLYLWRVAF